ncbi:MAG: PASTA domain-containing protein [Anaerorhabdus sp.]
MEDKSFLNTLSKDAQEKSNQKPKSFQEESFQINSNFNNKKFNPKVIIATILTLIIAFALVWFMFLAPKITMPDFQGKTISDINNWLKQSKVSSSGIVVEREYNLEIDEDGVINQSIKAGKKIKKDTAITFTVSNGADPNELISIPDIMSMSKVELEAWKEDNKLTRTKINTVYSDDIAEGVVIDYKLSDIEENEFKRSSNLTINISKGVAPLKDVVVVNYVGKTFEEFNSWASKNKLNIVKVEKYSDEVEAGLIISQSLKENEKLKEGETITVTVSQGAAVTIPNFTGYTKDMLAVWKQTNSNITVIEKEEYNELPLGSVISQSVKEGTKLQAGDVIVITTSLYMPELMKNSHQWIGKDYLELIAWVDDVNYKGASIAAGAWGGEICPEDNAEAVSGQILEVTCMDKNGEQLPYAENGCARPLPVDAKISMKIVAKGCPVSVE